MKYRILPSQEYLQECFRYERITGKLFWLKRPLSHFDGNARIWKAINSRCTGKEAFTYITPSGHKFGSISGVTYFAHRIIWKFVTGKEPLKEIDHKNRCEADNRWKNLRLADNSENQINRSHSWGKLKTPGLRRSQNKKSWEARIHKNKKYYHLGTFSTKAAAIAARQQAAKDLYGVFAP